MSHSPPRPRLPQIKRPETHYRVFTPIDRSVDAIDDTIYPSIYCSHCQQIQEWYACNLDKIRNWVTIHGEKEHEKAIPHKANVEALVASSRGGCHMCTIMVESLLVHVNRVLEGGVDVGDWLGVLIRNMGSRGPITALIHISSKRYGVRSDRSHAKIIPKVQLPDQEFHGATMVPRVTSRASIPRLPAGQGWPIRTDSSRCYDVIKEWLNRCVKTHTACGTPATQSLPTRLLYVFQNSQDITCQLIHTETASTKNDCRYVVLSYCWGSTATVKLTTDTKDSLLQGVNVSCLPQTIQDAISVTLKLGLSFIWVDSLCIIQDSVEDWEKEAARMSDVYLGSFVCVAGRGASNNGEGLFALRDPLRQAPCDLIDNAEDDHYLAIWPPLYAAQPWPLESRGWVLQERALPPRMIKFGPYICWECRECAADEFGLETHDPRGLPALPGAHERIIKEFYDTIIGTQHRGEKVDEAAALDMWRALVDEYSNTSLTYIQDRYAAIGGLVAAVQQSLGWTPKWGLWTEHMFEGMYWSVAAETEVTRTGVGPTWSWLSVNGSVVHYGASENTELAIIHAETAKANLESLPTDLRDKVITVVAHPLHAQEVEDTQYGLLSQPAEWSHGDGSTSLTERIHWRLDLRDLDAHPVTECLFLPLRAGTKSPSMQGIVVSPSSAHAGFYERCGDWDILQWQKREDGASDGYRCALDIIRSLPQEALAIV